MQAEGGRIWLYRDQLELLISILKLVFSMSNLVAIEAKLYCSIGFNKFNLQNYIVNFVINIFKLN